MEVLPDWLENWKKLIDEKNKKLDETGTKIDYWDNPKYTGNMDWCASLDYLVIKNAEKEGKIYDIDRFFWNEGKLFGYETELTKDGTGSIAKIIKDDRPYTISFRFDWAHCCLLIQCVGLDEETNVPVGARREITFGMLFGVKSEIVKPMIERSIEEMLITIKKMIDDDKKDNRNS